MLPVITLIITFYITHHHLLPSPFMLSSNFPHYSCSLSALHSKHLQVSSVGSIHLIHLITNESITQAVHSNLHLLETPTLSTLSSHPQATHTYHTKNSFNKHIVTQHAHTTYFCHLPQPCLYSLTTHTNNYKLPCLQIASHRTHRQLWSQNFHHRNSVITTGPTLLHNLLPKQSLAHPAHTDVFKYKYTAPLILQYTHAPSNHSS